MLIIAIPKSASTSLQATLGRLHNLPSHQDMKSIDKDLIPNNFRILSKYHSDCRELSKLNVDNWTTNKAFFIQHVPPTKNNINLFYNSPKVVLLRPLKEIILSYKRAEEKGIHNKIEGFSNCTTEQDWLQRAKEIGLTKELDDFINGWSNNHLPSTKIIYYEELLNSPTETINKISAFWGLKSKFTNVMLERARYSRDNKLQRLFYRVRKKINGMFHLGS